MTLQQDTYHDRQVTVLAVNSVLVVLSVGAVALRFWARRLRQVGLYVDDYLIVAGLLFALGVNDLLYAALWAGLGKHVRNLSRNTVQGYALNLFAIELFWNTTMPVIKFSILIFLKRLFPVGFVKPICNAIMVFLALWFLAVQFTTIFQCRPIYQAWMHTDISRCVSLVVFGAAAAGTNTLTEVILLVLPMTQIWKLQMRVGKKIGSPCIFALGFVICAVSIARLESLIVEVQSAKEDLTWTDTYPHLWTAVEGSLGVVVACLPHLMPVIQKITGTLDTVLSSSRSSSMGTATRQESRTSHVSTSQLKRGRISRRVEIDQSEAYEKAPAVENGSVITSLIEKAVSTDASKDWKRSPMPPEAAEYDPREG